MSNPNPYLASSLVADIKRRGQIPETSDGSYGVDEILAIASDEAQGYMTTLLMGIREEWFVRPFDQSLQSNKTKYTIPTRSVGSKIRQVLIGQEPNWQVVQRVEPKQSYGFYYGFSTGAGAYPTAPFGPAYYFENTTINLLSASYSGPTLRMKYFFRPARIVQETSCGLITDIDTNTNEVTIENLPANGTFTDGTLFDFVQAQPWFGTPAFDQPATFSGNVMTFASLPSDLVVGDYVCLAGEAPMPQLPPESHRLLAQRCVVKILEGMGDPKVAVAKEMCDEERAACLVQLDNRSEGDARYLTNFQGPGWNLRYRYWG